jgi:hypothetical protein
VKTAPLDELYLQWLYEQVADSSEADPSRTHWGILRQMYVKEFVWFVPNDDNRIEDGKFLRQEFADSLELCDVDPGWLQLGCSMLELLVGLSRRLAFEAEGEPRDWFWQLMKNLGLHRYDDCRTYPSKAVGDALDRVIWRTYAYDGSGGLFPLKDAREDQREVELWYQLCAYVLEKV